eukprot:CAMPEP_0185272760 /NCGR_PEP_ID=MMETSP1359-20130426/48061_1 /TAXON_ID=552665 /ORGANISM="Bigelowiella longifila, Strain CCMP242" /LENGTH=244 /DNA_ID=CAMNT_0027865173 /DNA_START=59 /DNA_END=793 /DNA_ORIENTATION=-
MLGTRTSSSILGSQRAATFRSPAQMSTRTARFAQRRQLRSAMIKRFCKVAGNEEKAPAAEVTSPESKAEAKDSTPQTAAKEEANYRTLMKVELPEFIPRPDLMTQFLRWAYIEVSENSKANFGIDNIDIEPIYLAPHWVERYGEDPNMKVVNGFKAHFAEAELEVVMDEEIILGYDYLGMDENGFPEKRGDSFEILGKFLEVRRVGSNPVSEKTAKAIRNFGKHLNTAFDKYYAFGSIYSDDAT